MDTDSDGDSPYSSARLERRRFRVRGVVQGVGFRPFVYGLAGRHGLGGFVLNDGDGVMVEAEGDAAALDAFAASLRADAPPLARVEAVTAEPVPVRDDARFTIAPSRASRGAAAIPPDVATCDDCLRELFDPADRRYRYPFLNCTHCGPALHDRPRACPTTAPRRRWPASRCAPTAGASTRTRPTGASTPSRPPAPCAGRGSRCRSRRRSGCFAQDAILAVKGLGGYHLACDARDEEAVATLRARKRREEKPFALMSAAPEALGDVSGEERALLRSPARPIVLLRRRGGGEVAASVAPGSPWLGVMLPYTPLHHLLAAEFGRPARADEREPLRRADRLRRRRGSRAARRGRRRLPRARPADPPPLRGLRRARRIPAAPLARVRAGRAAAPGRRSDDRRRRAPS